MIRPEDLKKRHRVFGVKHRSFSALLFVFLFLALMFVLSGCTLKDVIEPVSSFFGREASKEEETAGISSENMLLSAQVNDASGRALMKADGEPMTVLVAYETATGGEPRISPEGELETYPLGEIMTYAPGEVVTMESGEPVTYAGGEVIRDILGFPRYDENGDQATRAYGEIMTHGEDAIIYDAEGERMRYNGEYETYAPGDFKYDTEGEKETYAVIVQKDSEGEPVTDAEGNIKLGEIELVTKENGDPLIEENGEAATKQLDPHPPEKKVEEPFASGRYYINNVTSRYVYFSAPTVNSFDIALVADEGVDPYQYASENGNGTVNNLQLEMLGDDLPYYDVRFDLEGYAYFIQEGTDQALTVAGGLRNGVNVLLKDIERKEYPQYKYWDDPVYTVADNQKWVIREESDGSFSIRSAQDEKYAMTVDDQFGTQFANIMLWSYEGRELQRFSFSSEVPHIEKHIEEGIYYISSGLSDWMMMSMGDYNYSDGSQIYLYPSDQGDGQMIELKYDKYGFAMLYHTESNKALSVSYADVRNGQTICQYEADGGDWQKWIIDPHKHGGYYIRSALNMSEVMDLKDGEARSEKEILMHWNNETLAQSWFFKKEAIPSPYYYAYMDEYAQNFTSATDYLILVSSDTNHVGVYKGSKGKWENIQYWDCVTGKQSTPTVKGEFSIYFKTPSFDGNMDSPAWYTVYYASCFYPQYFFHSIIYYQGTKDIMDSSMGWNLSHGCVRLYTDNAQWIYDNIPIDTKVVSY